MGQEAGDRRFGLSVLVDARNRRPIQPMSALSHDGRVLAKHNLFWALPTDVARRG